MRLFSIFFSVFITLTGINGSFMNPYPRFKFFSDGGNPGDALYLTKYIENGDIEKVSLTKFYYNDPIGKSFCQDATDDAILLRLYDN